MSINANTRHLMSHSYLTISNCIMPVCTSQSLPPLRPCLTSHSHFRQGWGCECTFHLAPPDFGFDNFRIKSTNPVSQAVVYFAISFTTSCTLILCLDVLMHASLKIAQPLEYFLRSTVLVLSGFAIHYALSTSARNTSTEPYFVRLAVHIRDPS